MNWKHVYIGVPALVAFLGSLAYFGLDFSGFRPAWAYEHASLQQVVYERECRELNREWAEAKKVEHEYRDQDVPDWVIDWLTRIAADKQKYNCASLV